MQLWKPKTLGLAGLMATIAMFAIGTIGASAAMAAAPEFTGTFPNTYTGTGGAATLETEGGTTVKCTSTETAKGSLTSAKVGEVEVIFKGCKAAEVLVCTTAGEPAGEIKTNLLATKLGFIEKTTEPGVALSKKGGGVLAAFDCEGVEVSVSGSVIGKITPTKTSTTTFTLAFTQTAGKQTYTKLEGEAEDVLLTSVDGGTAEKSGEAVSTTLKTERATEITT